MADGQGIAPTAIKPRLPQSVVLGRQNVSALRGRDRLRQALSSLGFALR